MIRYQITQSELEQKIKGVSNTWLRNAKKKTARFKKLKKYSGKTGSWGKIKSVYMEIQNNKCAYCEQKFEGGPIGAINHDIEHYRPKSSVKVWPDQKARTELGITYAFSTGANSRSGYYLLAYDILNYMTACKPCNTMLKLNYFPIAGSSRITTSDNLDSLKKERPLLIYPLCDIDEDPEVLIGFQGTVPVPMVSRGYKKNRARVTIDFFRLLVGREDLLKDRALLIKALYWAYQETNSANPNKRRDAQSTIRNAERGSSAHTNCARSFLTICRTDRQLAKKYYDGAADYLASKGY